MSRTERIRPPAAGKSIDSPSSSSNTTGQPGAAANIRGRGILLLRTGSADDVDKLALRLGLKKLFARLAAGKLAADFREEADV